VSNKDLRPPQSSFGSILFIVPLIFLIRHRLFPLAAILAEIGEKWEHAENKRKLARWYWCDGIFGELYGSAVESRFAKDILEVPAWLAGGSEPTTVRDGVLRADRLRTMRSRGSAAYKGRGGSALGACPVGKACRSKLSFVELVVLMDVEVARQIGRASSQEELKCRNGNQAGSSYRD
jgi:hypothetical protein